MSTKRKEYKVDAHARKAEQNWGVEGLAELWGWRRGVMIANCDATALSAFAFATAVAPYAPYPPPAALEGIATGSRAAGGAAAGGGRRRRRLCGAGAKSLQFYFVLIFLKCMRNTA